MAPEPGKCAGGHTFLLVFHERVPATLVCDFTNSDARREFAAWPGKHEKHIAHTRRPLCQGLIVSQLQPSFDVNDGVTGKFAGLLLRRR